MPDELSSEFRFALALVYRQLQTIAAQASEAHATALALQRTVETSAELAIAFEQHNHSQQVTEIRLQAAHMQVSLRQVIEKLETLNT